MSEDDMGKYPWQKEIQEAIISIALKYCLNRKEILSFFTATVAGQFALCELSEDFVKLTLDKMYESYIRIRKEEKP